LHEDPHGRRCVFLQSALSRPLPHDIYRASNCQPAHSHSLCELHYLGMKVSTGKMISLHQGRDAESGTTRVEPIG
jgi:hypothetical protein